MRLSLVSRPWSAVRACLFPSILLPTLLAILLGLAATPTLAEKRVALVIGNAAYTVKPLRNPGNDAREIAKKLEAMGFVVVGGARLNLTYEGMRQALAAFAREARGADIAVVYYAGHGTENRGRNYLIPIDATLDQASDLDLQAIPLDTILGQLEGARLLKLVILDACRNDIFPLTGSKRAASRGLARVEPADNTLVAFAAEAGTTAEDGEGAAHSPFALALLKHLATPGEDVRLVLGAVRDDVVAATTPKQVPHVYGTLGGSKVFLVPGTPPPVATDTPVVPAPTPGAERLSSVDAVERAWDRIKDTSSPALIKGFRKQFGKDNPYYDGLAEDRLAELARKADAQRVALLQAEDEKKRAAAEETKRQEAERKGQVIEAERQRLALRRKAEDDKKQVAAEEARRKEDADAARQRAPPLAEAEPKGTFLDKIEQIKKKRIASTRSRELLVMLATDWPEMKDAIDLRLAALDQEEQADTKGKSEGKNPDNSAHPVAEAEPKDRVFELMETIIASSRDRDKLAKFATDWPKLKDAVDLRLAALDQEERPDTKGKNEAKKSDNTAHAVGSTFRDCATCPEMVVVPAGKFLMGSPESEARRSTRGGPQHEVTIRQPFAVGKFEVMFAEWDACVADGGCTHKPEDKKWGRETRPVINVSWYDAQAYIAWLNKKTGLPTGQGYRLLTEAEWEYAARAGTTTPFSFGETISTDQANYCGVCSYSGGKRGVDRRKTIEVGSFPANAFGLHDMHGNVREWVEDCWHENYSGAPSDGTAWTTSCLQARQVLRGGSWNSYLEELRAAYRYWDSPGARDDWIGFRLARTLFTP